MIVNAWGIVLSRRDSGEADRLCTIYTETMGKLLVRFAGVNKPGRKLKALSEPFVCGEYRLYVSAKSDIGKAIGGQLIGSFPGIREDFTRTIEALCCCELLSALTANNAPNPEEYNLLLSALRALESSDAGLWLPIAYGLRLLVLAGYGLPERSPEDPDRELFAALHEQPLESLGLLPWDPIAAARLRQALYAQAEAQAGRPLKSRDFLEKIHAEAGKAPSEVLT